MAAQLLVVEDNTAPPIVITLQRNGTAIDLTGSTVALSIKLNGVVTNTAHTACTINSPATAGIISYSPQAVDFADAGTYDAEVKISYGNGTVERIYEKFKISVRTKVGS